jgi:hypothetical protein
VDGSAYWPNVLPKINNAIQGEFSSLYWLEASAIKHDRCARKSCGLNAEHAGAANSAGCLLFLFSSFIPSLMADLQVSPRFCGGVFLQ